jgi:hypothetical protein
MKLDYLFFVSHLSNFGEVFFSLFIISHKGKMQHMHKLPFWNESSTSPSPMSTIFHLATNLLSWVTAGENISEERENST